MPGVIYDSSPYISEEAAEKLRNYKYPGTDDRSPWYKYVLVPTADRLVTKMPRWLAPNTITVSGLILVAVSSIVSTCYCPSFEGHAPSWTYFLSGISMMAYQLLDVSDGKQARRTGNGSPLGLLFDHGIDAFNVILGGVPVAASLQMGPTWRAPAIVLAAKVSFFFGTWEEYYTGVLYLPPFNGPNEGLLIVMCVHFYNAIFTPAIWTQPFPWYPELSNNTVFLICTCAGTVINAIANIIGVCTHIRRNPQKGFTVQGALSTLVPFGTFMTIVGVWLVISPAGIVARYPNMCLWGVGLICCKLVMHMMLAHLCSAQFSLMRKTLVPIFLISAHASLQCVTGFLPKPNCIEPLMEEEAIATIFFYLSLITYAHMVYNLVQEIKVILGIYCFTVKPGTELEPDAEAKLPSEKPRSRAKSPKKKD